MKEPVHTLNNAFQTLLHELTVDDDEDGLKMLVSLTAQMSAMASHACATVRVKSSAKDGAYAQKCVVFAQRLVTLDVDHLDERFRERQGLDG